MIVETTTTIKFTRKERNDLSKVLQLFEYMSSNPDINKAYDTVFPDGISAGVMAETLQDILNNSGEEDY